MEKTAKYEEHRTYINGIIDAMARNETELEGRLSELRDQKKMLEDCVQSLKVFEHINKE